MPPRQSAFQCVCGHHASPNPVGENMRGDGHGPGDWCAECWDNERWERERQYWTEGISWKHCESLRWRQRGVYRGIFVCGDCVGPRWRHEDRTEGHLWLQLPFDREGLFDQDEESSDYGIFIRGMGGYSPDWDKVNGSWGKHWPGSPPVLPRRKVQVAGYRGQRLRELTEENSDVLCDRCYRKRLSLIGAQAGRTLCCDCWLRRSPLRTNVDCEVSTDKQPALVDTRLSNQEAETEIRRWVRTVSVLAKRNEFRNLHGQLPSEMWEDLQAEIRYYEKTGKLHGRATWEP